MISAIARGSNTNTIINIKNLTTVLSDVLNASATKRNPPTSFSNSILLFLITFIESNDALFFIVNSSIRFYMEVISLSAERIILDTLDVDLSLSICLDKLAS